jgi:cytidylate kinase
MPLVVTIDGPAGAGKSTVARRLAARLGWRFLDTGAMYRAVTLAAMRAGTDMSSEPALCNLVESLAVNLPPGRVLLGGEDVTESIRDPAVTGASRFIADSPGVRRRLTIWQRAFGEAENVITEGRDQGTVVFPTAFRKYYLTASDDERARRRLAENMARGHNVSFESMLAELRARNARDAARAIAPMKPAEDATVVDSTGLSVEEVVDRLARDIEGASILPDTSAQLQQTCRRFPEQSSVSMNQPNVQESGAVRASGPGSEHRRAELECPDTRVPVADRAESSAEPLLLATPDAGRKSRSVGSAAGRDRSATLWLWYRFARLVCATLSAVVWRWRANGHSNVPESGGTLLVCNHASFLDVFFLAFPLRRPLNYVARSTLFVPVLGPLMRSVGGFPIQREGLGASGMKETLRRLRAGGIVVLFPEGTRSRDGELGSLKPGIAALAARVGVPVVPAALAGMFEVWPRSRFLPVPNPVRIHFGRPILPQDLAGLNPESITALIETRMRESHADAARALQQDLTY